MEKIKATSKTKKRKIIFIILGILLLALLIAALVSYLCYREVHIEGDGLLIYKEYADSIEKRDIVIVPGGAAPDGYPGTQLSRRLDGAIFMYEGEYVDEIIISGNKYETTAMNRYLQNHDIPKDAVIIDNYSEDTLDTIRRAQEYSPDSTFYVCTQEFYSYRTGYFIKDTGIDAKIVNSDLIVFQTNFRNNLREYLAATKAVFETHLFKFSKTKSVEDYKMEGGK